MIDLELHRARLSSAGVEVLEQEDTAVRFLISTQVGPVVIVADLIRIEDTLVLDRTHVDGPGLTLPLIRKVAKALGEVENVVEVIIQGGDRSSGANRGSSPTPIRVRVI